MTAGQEIWNHESNNIHGWLVFCRRPRRMRSSQIGREIFFITYGNSNCCVLRLIFIYFGKLREGVVPLCPSNYFEWCVGRATDRICLMLCVRNEKRLLLLVSSYIHKWSHWEGVGWMRSRWRWGHYELLGVGRLPLFFFLTGCHYGGLRRTEWPLYTSRWNVVFIWWLPLQVRLAFYTTIWQYWLTDPVNCLYY